MSLSRRYRLSVAPLLLMLAVAACDDSASITSEPLFLDPRIVTPIELSSETQASTVTAVSEDLDGDGVLDAIVGGQLELAMARGLGDGRFSITITSLEESLLSVTPTATVDLVDEPRPVLFASAGAFGLALFRINNDASFSALSVLTLGPPNFDHRALGSADVDGDGFRDPLSSSSEGITTWRRDSTGAFVEVVLFATSALVDRAQAGDFNGDGLMDLVYRTIAPSFWHLILGDGQGGFTAGPGGPIAAEDVASGDLDGDGDLDLIHRDSFLGIRLRANDGTGIFAPGQTIDPGTAGAPWSSGLSLIDLNGDGLLDILNPGVTALVLTQVSPLVFETEGFPELGRDVVKFVATDADRDGLLDLLGISKTHVSVMPGSMNGPLDRPLHASPEYGTISSLEVHTTSLGRRILLLTSGLPSLPSRLTSYALEGDALQRISTVVLPNGIDPSRRPRFGDMNGDGVDELIYSGLNVYSVTIDPSGVLGSPATVSSVLSGTIVPTDVDQDGDVDLVDLTMARILLNDGSGLCETVVPGPAFASAPYTPNWYESVTTDFAVRDLDGDGRNDVIYLAGQRSSPAIAALHFGASIPYFTPFLALGALEPATTPFSFPPLFATTLYDMDSDGEPDYLDLSGSRWFRNRGDGYSDEPARELPTGMTGGSALVGDLDGNGEVLDVLTMTSEGSVAWLPAGTSATLRRPLRQAPGAFGTHLIDLDGDGRDDLVGFLVDHVIVWRNRGNLR